MYQTTIGDPFWVLVSFAVISSAFLMIIMNCVMSSK